MLYTTEDGRAVRQRALTGALGVGLVLAALLLLSGAIGAGVSVSFAGRLAGLVLMGFGAGFVWAVRRTRCDYTLTDRRVLCRFARRGVPPQEIPLSAIRKFCADSPLGSGDGWAMILLEFVNDEVLALGPLPQAERFVQLLGLRIPYGPVAPPAQA